MTQPAIPTVPSLELSAETMADFFPEPPATSLSQQVTPATNEPPQPSPSTVQPVQTEEPFVKGSSSVYKTKEATIQGINEKDALIQELRQQYSLATGVDPITKRPLSQTTQGPVSYSSNPNSYVDDLKKANTPEALMAVQQRLIMDTLAPIAPAVSGMARNQALRQLEGELSDFQAFYGSASYNKTLDNVPSLREAIQAAESDIRFSPRLTELYKLAYLADKGTQLPELLKRQQTSQSQPQLGQTTSRPTTPTPEPSTPQTPASLGSSAGRKAIIAEFEARQGNKTLAWEQSRG